MDWAVQLKFVTPAKSLSWCSDTRAGAYGWAGMGRVLIFVTPAKAGAYGWVGMGRATPSSSSHPRDQSTDGWAVQIKFVTPAKAGAYGWVGMGRVLIFVTPANPATYGWVGMQNSSSSPPRKQGPTAG